MSDKMRGLPFADLCRYVKAAEKDGQLFGIPEQLFPAGDESLSTVFFDHILDNPLGAAAGPHTQMAQNIISAYLCGARYIELKTVQILDQLELSKPCIDMEDEGFNCEWSQELSLTESFHEYCNAWIICNYLAAKKYQRKNGNGFMFNFSIGYNLEGILSDKMQAFIGRISNAEAFIKAKIDSVSSFFPELKKVKMDSCISDCVTLSTMHGCPPEEIEKIGLHLINEKGLNTLVKLNPTLAGKKKIKEILNRDNAYPVEVPAEAFRHDLSLKQAKPIISSLKKAAIKKSVQFAVKLSNTLESKNRKNIFAKSEKTVYMSGRPLHPLTVETAMLLEKEFKGDLNVSFSGGADAYNIVDIAACGLYPVTVCSDILRPGGYARLGQYLERLKEFVRGSGFSALKEYNSNLSAEAKIKKLEDYSHRLKTDRYYRKNNFVGKSIKTDRDLPVYDCAAAPCASACPTKQDIPAYISELKSGRFTKALEIIFADNPFPNTTGTVCDHVCQYKCTRQNIDEALKIRELKHAAAEYAAEIPVSPAAENKKKAAIIGGGPSGLSCAWFLNRRGWKVSVFESSAEPGGMIRRVIPGFRLDSKKLDLDIHRIRSAGVKYKLNEIIDSEKMDRIRKEYDAVYVAVGAACDKKMGIKGENLPGVFGALDFLTGVKDGSLKSLQGDVCVIGGGNSAMDAARAALRMTSGKVRLVYRRTAEQMPADREELQAVIDENIEICELFSPLDIKKKSSGLVLNCQKMKLGKPDKSGRKRPLPVEGKFKTIECTTVISAIGQGSDFSFIKKSLLTGVDSKTAGARIYYGGDCLRGPASIITAVADGKKAAELIDDKQEDKRAQSDRKLKIPVYADHFSQLARRDLPAFTEHFGKEQAREEAGRCLVCSDICNVCVSVCPNRALFAVPNNRQKVPVFSLNPKTGETAKASELCLKQSWQIFRIADFCNECGNCFTFCPSNDAPWKKKRTICLNEQTFAESEDALFIGKDEIRFKQKNDSGILWQEKDQLIYTDGKLTASFNHKKFELIELDGPKNGIILDRPAELRLIQLLLENINYPGKQEI